MTADTPRSGWIKPLLVASLMVNILVAGAIAGRAFMRHHDDGFRGGPDAMGAFVRQLPAERGRIVREALREERGKLRPLRQGSYEARQDFAKQLASEPYDAVKVRAGAAAAVEADRKVKDAMFNGIAEIASRLTPAERAAMGDAMLARQKAWRQRRHDADDGTARRKD